MLDSVETYTELCVKLKLMGIDSFPPKSLFDMTEELDDAMFAEYNNRHYKKWFMGIVKHWIEQGKDLSKMNAVNCGFV